MLSVKSELDYNINITNQYKSMKKHYFCKDGNKVTHYVANTDNIAEYGCCIAANTIISVQNEQMDDFWPAHDEDVAEIKHVVETYTAGQEWSTEGDMTFPEQNIMGNIPFAILTPVMKKKYFRVLEDVIEKLGNDKTIEKLSNNLLSIDNINFLDNIEDAIYRNYNGSSIPVGSSRIIIFGYSF